MAVLSIPVITSLSPTSGTPGSQLTITGSGFLAPLGGATTVTFTSGASVTVATITALSSTQIVLKVPNSAVASRYTVSVTVDGIASNLVPYYFAVIPIIDRVSFLEGPPMMGLVITGSGFGITPGTVMFGTTAATTILAWSDTSITVQVPTIPGLSGIYTASEPIAVSPLLEFDSVASPFTVVNPFACTP